MNYEDALNSIACGGIVTLNGSVVYMSVNFNSGMAGKIVRLSGGKEVTFTPSADEISSEGWEVADNGDV